MTSWPASPQWGPGIREYRSPAVYRAVAEGLAPLSGLHPAGPDKPKDTALLARLADGAAETIAREGRDLS